MLRPVASAFPLQVVSISSVRACILVHTAVCDHEILRNKPRSVQVLSVRDQWTFLALRTRTARPRIKDMIRDGLRIRTGSDGLLRRLYLGGAGCHGLVGRVNDCDKGRERLRTHRRCTGRGVRLQQGANGQFDTRNKGRLTKQAVKARLWRPSFARSLRSRHRFTASQTFRRFGMLVLCALQDAAWRSITLARKEVEYLLHSWRHFFAGVRPRGISVQKEMPVLLLTDRGVE